MFSERDQLRLGDIVDNARRIPHYLDGVSFVDFQRDERTMDAVERCLQRLTEAVIQLGPLVTEGAGLAVPWHDVRSLGNRQRHDYRRIEPQVIYRTVTVDVPLVGEAARRALAR